MCEGRCTQILTGHRGFYNGKDLIVLSVHTPSRTHWSLGISLWQSSG